MITISTPDGQLELPKGFSMDVEDSSPVFNDRGSQSLPATVAPTPDNNRVLGYPCMPEASAVANLKDCTVTDGLYVRSGKINVVSASKKAGITFNVGFDNSTVYEEISKKKLTELDGLPVMDLGDSDPYEYLKTLYHDCPADSPLVVFPICTSIESEGNSSDGSSGEEKKNYCVILNEFYHENNAIKSTHSVTRLVDNKVTEVTVPPDFGITPFVKVWKVVEIVFEALGYQIDCNPFLEDDSLSRLVIPNNVADACCTGKIIYADILPDVTVAEFFDALWARFGFTFTLDPDSQVATLRLIRDIVAGRDPRDLTSFIAGSPEITIETPRCLKLSASFDIEGAQPAFDRWEDFLDGRDCLQVSYPDQVAYGDDASPNFFDPDWDLAYWNFKGETGYEDPTFGRRDAASRIEFYKQNPDKYSEYIIARNTGLSFDPETWMWHSVDYYTHKEDVDSSSFFNWDPNTEGCEALELTSVDVWVPMKRIKNFDDDSATGRLMPFFGVGTKFRHTYVSQGTDAQAVDKCPLAFLFVDHNSSMRSTVGTLATDNVALTYQFHNGLFERFWKSFDELLRHANRRMEFPATMPLHELRGIEMLRTIRVGNLTYLPDMVSYSMGGINALLDNATLALRPALTSGDYDLAKEQNIAEFHRGERHWRWCWISDNIRQLGETSHPSAIHIAMEQCPEWESANGPFAVNGEAPLSLHARFMSAKQVGTKWSSNPDLLNDAPASSETARQYDAELYYYVYGVQFKNGSYVMAENPGALVKVDVKYTVRLASKLLRC